MTPNLADLQPAQNTPSSVRRSQLVNSPFINARNLASLFYKKPDDSPILTFQETLDDRPGTIETVIRHEIAVGLVLDDSANPQAALPAAMNGAPMQPPPPNGPPPGMPLMAGPPGMPQGVPAMAPQPGAPAPVALGGTPQAQPEPQAPKARTRRGAGVAPPHAPPAPVHSSPAPAPSFQTQGQPMNFPTNGSHPQTYGTPGAPPAGNNFGPPAGGPGAFSPPPAGNFAPPPAGNFGPPPSNFGPPAGAPAGNFGPPPNAPQSFSPPQGAPAPVGNFGPPQGGQSFSPPQGGQSFVPQTAAPQTTAQAPQAAPVQVDLNPVLHAIAEQTKQFNEVKAELAATKLLATHALAALHHIYLSTPGLADGAGKSGLPVQQINGFRQFLDGFISSPQG